MTVCVLSWDHGRRIRSWRHGVCSPVARRPIPRSPDWLQLRTGYILSSGSLSTVPKRESDDYSCGARGARGKEKGEKMVGRVNACTKARLCIRIKDVSPHSFVSFFPFLFSFFFFFYFNPTTSSGTTLSTARVAYLVEAVQKTLRSELRRQYLMRSYDGHRRDETRILFGR